MPKPVVIQLDEKLKGSKLLGSPSRLTWEENGRIFVVEYKRRNMSLWNTPGARERSGAYGHGMLGVNQADAFFVKILDKPGNDETYSSLEEKEKDVEKNLCHEAESLNVYYGKDCCRVLRRTKNYDAGIATKRYYMLMPKERGAAVSVKLQNASSEHTQWNAAITQAMHPLYYMATLKRDKNLTFIHGDIKPLNLIWPDAPNAPFKLIDFGTANYSDTTDVIKINIDEYMTSMGFQSPQANEQETKLYDKIRYGKNEKETRKASFLECTFHDDHYAMAATLSLIFFKQFDQLPFIMYNELKKKTIDTGFSAPITDARNLVYYIAQLSNEEFSRFLARHDDFLTKEQAHFFQWIRPFTNGTSENTPEYIENKLQEYRTLFGMKAGEGISTYKGISAEHQADLNQLSSQPAPDVSVKEKTLSQVIANVFGAEIDDNVSLDKVKEAIQDAVSTELKRLDSGDSKYWYQLQRTDIKKYMPIHNAHNAFERNPSEASAKQLRDALNIKRNPSDSAEANALTNVKNALKSGGISFKPKH